MTEPKGLRLEYVPIDSIKPHSQNPRLGAIREIAESLKEHSQYRPIVVNRPTKEVLAGNQTLAAAKSLGWDEIAVVWVEVSEVDAKRIVLSDNRTHDLGGYSDPLLANLLRDVMEEDVGLLAGTGYSEQEVEDLLASTITEIELPTDVEREDIGSAVAALDRLLPPTQQQEAEAVAEADEYEDSPLFAGISPDFSPEGSTEPQVPLGEPQAFILVRLGQLRFKIHREAYERFFEALNEQARGDEIRAAEIVATRLGMTEADVKPPDYQGPEIWDS